MRKGGGLANVTFRQADICQLPFRTDTFDHGYVCFTLEHIPYSLLALGNLMTVFRPRGTITATEDDHGTAVFYPYTRAAHHVIYCLVSLQWQAGGNALIGRELEHLLTDAGFVNVMVSSRQTHASASIPRSSDAVKSIFIAMGSPRTDYCRSPGRSGGMGAGDQGPVPDHGRGRDVLLYIFHNGWEKGGCRPIIIL